MAATVCERIHQAECVAIPLHFVRFGRRLQRLPEPLTGDDYSGASLALQWHICTYNQHEWTLTKENHDRAQDSEQNAHDSPQDPYVVRFGDLPRGVFG